MAYVVQRPGGRWEIREAVTTARGPRSRTLATFRRLTPEVVERAVSRASRPASAAEIRAAARRAGAETAAADAAARTLLSELVRGRGPSPGLRRALIGWLADPPDPDPPGGSVVEWLDASPEDRGAVLAELLRFVDAVPPRPRGELRYPPLKQTARRGD